jgi:light-regulated signal transduction histidine kinase (bacteriophytochrome)
VRLTFGDMLAESSRGSLAPVKALELPPLIADAQSRSVPVFPRRPRDEAIEAALLRAPAAEQREELRECGVGAVMRVPFASGSGRGEFRCDSRTPREPSFELHAAAELFAQLFGMRLEIERLKGG